MDKTQMATNKQYLLIPLGLSFDNLVDAAIVATKKQNVGNTVHDTINDKEIDHKSLLNIVKKLQKPKQQHNTVQQSFFDSHFKILPMLLEDSEELFAAFAIVFKDGKIAATTRPDGSIGLPGGKIDPGEDAVACAKRESFEEGFDVHGSGSLVHTARVDGRKVAWVSFDDAVMLSSYKEKYRGITPIWTEVENVAGRLGNNFLLTMKK